jgi:disabled family protein 2
MSETPILPASPASPTKDVKTTTATPGSPSKEVKTPPPPTTTNNSNTKKFEGDGLTYKSKLIGVDELTLDRDEKICLDSMFKLKAVARARGEHKQRITLHLTMSGVKVMDDATKVFI